MEEVLRRRANDVALTGGDGAVLSVVTERLVVFEFPVVMRVQIPQRWKIRDGAPL
jgi:hypothetical protein